MAASRETPGDLRSRREQEAAPASGGRVELWVPPSAQRSAVAVAEPEPEVEVLPPSTEPVYGRRPAGGERRTVVASAVRIDLGDRKMIQSLRYRRQAWQSEAHDYVDEVPELGSVCDFEANLLSKLRLFAAVRPDPSGPPMPVDDEESGVDPTEAKIAIATLMRLRSLQGGQSVLIGDIAYNLHVAGELFLHGHEDPETGEEDWNIRSVDELVVTGDSFGLRSGTSATLVQQIPANDIVIRLWQRSRRFGSLAASPMRRVLSTAENLLLLDRELRATSSSRLPSGVLALPQELSLGPADPTRDQGDGEADEDPFLADFNQAVMTAIQEPGAAAAIAPIVIQGPGEHLDKIKLIKFGRGLDVTLEKRIEGQVMRLARGMAMPVEVSTGLQECVDETTQILTQRGWLTVDELSVDDWVYTLNHEIGVAEWQPVQKVSIYDVQEHPMFLSENKSHSSFSTLDHRWPVIVSGSGQRLWRHSATLTLKDRIVTAAPCVDLPTEAKYSDALVEVVAWHYTEGSVDRRGYANGGGIAIISQDEGVNPGNVARIRTALTEVFGPPADSLLATGPNKWWGPDAPPRRWPTEANSGRPCKRCGVGVARNRGGIPVCEACAKGRRDYREPKTVIREQRDTVAWTETRDPNRPMARFRLSHAATAALDEVAPDRVPSGEFLRSLTQAQLELFLAVSGLADGWIVNSGTRMFSQADKRRIDAYELAVILSGRTPSSWTGGATKQYPDHVQHFCSMTDRTTVMALRATGRHALGHRQEVIHYTGRIWCPTTANQTWLARRHGRVYFTGNTTFANAAQVKRSEWDSYGEPKATLIVDALTSGYYQWALEEAGIPRERARQHFIWYDPSACIAAPDPIDAADKGLEEGNISGEAWRRVKGFAESDAPDNDELLLRVLLKATRVDPFILAQLFKITGLAPDIEIPAPQSGILGEAAEPPVQAALMAALTDKRGARLGRRLLDIDRDLRTRLHTAAEAAMRRALERAGNRVKSRLGRPKNGNAPMAAATATARELIAEMAPCAITAALGPKMLTALGLSGDDLLDESFDDLGPDFQRMTAKAQKAALAALRAEGITLDDATLTGITQRQDVHRDAAWDVLLTGLVALAGQRLFDPTPGATQGESDDSTVPVGLLREALAVAGGDNPQGGAGGSLRSMDGSPVGGVATGPDVLSATDGVEAWQWDYGSAPRTEFPPHGDLADQPFESWDDDVLINDTGWPDAYCYPGDHDGCCCDAIPTLVMPGGTMPTDTGGGEGE